MNNDQLLSRIQEMQRMLTAMGRVFSTTENLSEDAFSGYEDQWPDALESELRSLERMLSRFQADESERDFIDLLVAGRPQLGALANDAEAASNKAANGLLSAFETLNDEDSPSSGFSSWHWFEHAFRDFLHKQSRFLSAAKDVVQIQMGLEDSKSNDRERSGYRDL